MGQKNLEKTVVDVLLDLWEENCTVCGRREKAADMSRDHRGERWLCDRCIPGDRQYK